MRVLIERTGLTDAQGRHVRDLIRERYFIDADDVVSAIGNFADKAGAKILGSVSQVSDQRAIATARGHDGLLFTLAAQLADELS